MDGWQKRVDAIWADDAMSGQDRIDRIDRIDRLAGARPAGDAIALLRTEYERGADAPLHDATSAFYALALASNGDAVTAVSVALKALAPHLPRYTRSVSAYADELVAGA